MAEGMRLRDYYGRVWVDERGRRKPKTWAKEEGIWTGRLLPVLGDVRMRELSTATFDTFMRGLTKEDGSPLGYHYLCNIRKAYQALLKEATLRGLRMQSHVYRRLDDAPKDTLGAFDTLTPAEVERLCDAASSPREAAMFAYAFYTGTRPSETARVQWDAFDWTPQPLSPFGRVRVAVPRRSVRRTRSPLPRRFGGGSRHCTRGRGHPSILMAGSRPRGASPPGPPNPSAVDARPRGPPGSARPRLRTRLIGRARLRAPGANRPGTDNEAEKMC